MACTSPQPLLRGGRCVSFLCAQNVLYVVNSHILLKVTLFVLNTTDLKE
jgi:hypothetical protein